MTEFRILRRNEIVESANPRHHYDPAKYKELVESIRDKGIIEPILVRPSGENKYQIVFGSRRFKAANEAKVDAIPAIVQSLTDQEVLELQMIENLQRDDLHPLDEADGYKQMIEWKYDVAKISDKIKKSISYVYQRLKLSSLIPEVHKAFLADKITAGHAILIARLQPKDQVEALRNAFDRYGDKELLGVRHLTQWIDEHVHLDLHSAPFKKDDPLLVPRAGACTTCPKRTGYVPDLFPDIKKKDTCTDPSCFNEKIQAFLAEKIKELKQDTDKPVLLLSGEYRSYGAKEDKGILTRENYHAIQPQEKSCEHSSKGIIVKGGNIGQVLNVCTSAVCKIHKPQRAGYQRMRQETPKEKEQRQAKEKKERLERVLRQKIFDATVAKIPDRFTKPDLVFICSAYFAEIWYENQKLLSKRHGLKETRQFGKYIAGLDLMGLNRLLMEMALIRVYASKPFGEKDPLLVVAERYGVSPNAIKKDTDKEKKKPKARVAKSKTPLKIVSPKVAKKPHKMQTSAKKKEKKK